MRPGGGAVGVGVGGRRVSGVAGEVGGDAIAPVDPVARDGVLAGIGDGAQVERVRRAFVDRGVAAQRDGRQDVVDRVDEGGDRHGVLAVPRGDEHGERTRGAVGRIERPAPRPAGVVLRDCPDAGRDGDGVVTFDVGECAAVGRVAPFVDGHGRHIGRDGRRLVHVGHGDRENSLDEQPTLVGAAHPDGIAAFGLKIEARRRPQLPGRVDVEARVVGVARPAYQRIYEGVPVVRVTRGERADRGPHRSVLGDRAGRQGHVRGRLVHVRQEDRHHVAGEQAAGVCDLHLQVEPRIRLIVEPSRVGHGDHARGADREGSETIPQSNAEGLRVRRVRITCHHRPDDHAVPRILRDEKVLHGDGRRFVDVRHTNRENLLEEEAALVPRPDSDRIAILDLIVKSERGHQMPGWVNREVEVVGAPCSGHQAVREDVSEILVGRAECPNQNAGKAAWLILGDRATGQRDIRGSVIQEATQLRANPDAAAAFVKKPHKISIVDIIQHNGLEAGGGTGTNGAVGSTDSPEDARGTAAPSHGTRVGDGAVIPGRTGDHVVAVAQCRHTKVSDTVVGRAPDKAVGSGDGPRTPRGAAAPRCRAGVDDGAVVPDQATDDVIAVAKCNHAAAAAIVGSGPHEAVGDRDDAHGPRGAVAPGCRSCVDDGAFVPARTGDHVIAVA